MPVNLKTPDALQSAHHGMAAGLAQLARGAVEVQEAAHPYSDEDTVNVSEEAAAFANGEHPPSIQHGLMDMRLARYAVLANMAAMRAADETMQEAVKIARRSYWVAL